MGSIIIQRKNGRQDQNGWAGGQRINRNFDRAPVMDIYLESISHTRNETLKRILPKCMHRQNKA